jgi:hypothetical protein
MGDLVENEPFLIEQIPPLFFLSLGETYHPYDDTDNRGAKVE